MAAVQDRKWATANGNVIETAVNIVVNSEG
jgi:hypothetical protein